MSTVELALTRIEAMVDEIEILDRALGGIARHPSDREAFDIVCRIERRMLSRRQQDAAE